MQEPFYARLRRAPTTSSVPGSLPVLFFGDLFTAHAVTVGLNPSHREYLDTKKRELDGANRRFETLSSLGASNRSILTNEQCDRAVQVMRTYFQLGKPIYSWFRPLERVVQPIGFSYQTGEVAHLDLVQEATDPTWSNLSKTSPDEFTALRFHDLPFLRWQLETFPVTLILCNGRTVFDEVRNLIGGQVRMTGVLKKLKWYVGTASIAGRHVTLAGWNLPLTRPTGLGTEGETNLGQVIASALKEAELL